MSIEVHPKTIFTRFLVLIVALSCANVAGIISRRYFDHGRILWLIQLFDFNTEQNIPTLYSSFALLVVSILLSIIATMHRKQGSPYLHWLGLALVFLFLAIDETVSIHERFGVPIRESWGASGFLYYAWIIPYGSVLVVLVIIYSRFLIRLPRKIMILFLISGAVFVTGAIGFEAIAGRLDDLYGYKNTVIYRLLYTFEEFLEMLGVATFIYTLLLYITSQFKTLTISINEQG